MSHCNIKFDNTLNFLPSIQPKKPRTRSVSRTKTPISTSRSTRRGYLTPQEKKEMEIENNQIESEIEKWEKIRKNKFMRNCRKLKVESMAPAGFDLLLEDIMRFVISVKPGPKDMIRCISSFLDKKLEENVMKRYDLRENMYYDDDDDDGFCTLDETALFLEKSDIDPAPRDIYHMEYQGKIIPPWNEKLKPKYRDEAGSFLERSKFDPAPIDSCHPRYQGVLRPPWNEKLGDVDETTTMLEESKIDVPPITEFQTGYEKGIKPSVVMVTDPCLADENSPVMDTSEIDPPPIDTCHLGYEKGKATAKTKSSSACFKKDTKKTSSKSRSQVLPVVL